MEWAPETVSRAEWDARMRRAMPATVAMSSRTGAVLHYSAGPTSQTVRRIQDYHMDSKGWSDIGYNFLTDQSGKLYEGRGWLATGAHVAGHNKHNLGLCWIGGPDDVPSADALRTIGWWFTECDRRAGKSLHRYGHRDLAATSCPGDRLYAWLHSGMPSGGGDTGMELSDRVKFVTGQAVNYSQPDTTVAGILASTNYYVLQSRNAILAALAASQTREEAMLAAINTLASSGTSVDTAAVISAVEHQGTATRAAVLDRLSAAGAVLAADPE